MFDDEYDIIHQTIEALERANINFVAIDFDLTLIDVHTEGRWEGTSLQLVPHIRPMFYSLIPELLERGIFVAIVTFSPQTAIIRETLTHAFPQHVDRIVIRCKDKNFELQAGSANQHGKMQFMASAACEIADYFLANRQEEITRASTLLIDDTRKNVEIALDNCVRALLFHPQEPERILQDIMELA